MLPVSVWYKAMEAPAGAAKVRATSPPTKRRSFRRLVGGGLIRLGHAISGPPSRPRSALADGFAPR
jgi:hypothetical protein